MSKMDVDSLLCLNADEQKSFELLQLEKEKSLNKILENLDKSIDYVVHDTGNDVLEFNFENSKSEINFSAAAFGDLINVVSSTLADLKISEKNKTHLHQNECEELITLTDQDQRNYEFTDKSHTFRNETEISSRYPELFEIFSESAISQYSNLNISSEVWNQNNIAKHLTNEKPEKCVENSPLDTENFRRGISSKKLHSQFIEDIPEKLPSRTLQTSREIFKHSENLHFSNESCENRFKKLIGNNDPLMRMSPKVEKIQKSINSIQGKMSSNPVNRIESKIPSKRKKSDDEGTNYESQSSSKIKKISSSLENVPPLSASSVLSLKSNTSNSSLNSWITWRDTPRSNNEKYCSEFNFVPRSIHEAKSEIKRGNVKSKITDRSKTKKKKKKLSSNVEIVQGDVAVKENRVLEKNELKINSEKIQGVKKEKVHENKIFMDVIDILIGVKSNLFENRKLVESIQKHFQDCSTFHTVISDDVITLLNEGISRCAIRIQSTRRSKDLFDGTHQLLMNSILNLVKTVKEEKEYLKQQEYYYCKRFLCLENDDRCFGNSKKNTKHTLIGNATLLSSSQKTKIEELITYSVSLIKKIIPENQSNNKEILTNQTKRSPRRRPLSRSKAENGPRIQEGIVSKENNLNNKTNSSLFTNFENSKEIIKLKTRQDRVIVKQKESRMTNKNPSEKLIRSSTVILEGNYPNSKQSCQVVKATSKIRNICQPIWKPAGNAKVPTSSKQIARNVTASDKRKKKSNNEMTKNPSGSVETNSIRDCKTSQSQRTNLKSCDSVQRDKTEEAKIINNSKNMAFETSKYDLISKTQKENVDTSNLTVNQNLKRDKRKSKHPEAMQMLKELINSTSEEENKNVSKDLKTTENDSEISVHYLKFKNKLVSSRSSFASTIPTKTENCNISSNEEINLPKSSRLEKPLINCQGNKNYFSTPGSKNSLNLENFNSLKVQTPAYKSVAISDSIRRKVNSDRLINSSRLINSDRLVNSARLINLKPKVSVNEHTTEEKNDETSLVKSLNSKAKLEQNEFRKPYLRKSTNDISYLDSYVKFNSRQNLASNCSSKSLKVDPLPKKSKISGFKNETKVENEITADIQQNSTISKISNKSVLKQNTPPSTCESLVKTSSSKYCQVSLEPSTSSKNCDSEEVLEIELNSLASDYQFSDIFFTNKNHEDKKLSFLALKEILRQHGLNVDLIENDERKLNSKRKGSLKSILLDDGKGNILTICSSEILDNKISSLPNGNINEFKINDTVSSFESFNKEAKILKTEEIKEDLTLGTQEISETPFRTEDIKSKNSISICMLNKRSISSSPEEKIDAPFQTDSCPNKSEECQTFFTKNIDTTIEKILFENLIYNDIGISCCLENPAVSKSEQSTETLFTCAVKTQTSPRNSTNAVQILDEETNLINKITNKEVVSAIPKFNDNENLCVKSKDENAYKSMEKVSSISDRIMNHENYDLNFKENSLNKTIDLNESLEEFSFKNVNSQKKTDQQKLFDTTLENDFEKKNQVSKVIDEFLSNQKTHDPKNENFEKESQENYKLAKSSATNTILEKVNNHLDLKIVSEELHAIKKEETKISNSKADNDKLTNFKEQKTLHFQSSSMSPTEMKNNFFSHKENECGIETKFSPKNCTSSKHEECTNIQKIDDDHFSHNEQQDMKKQHSKKIIHLTKSFEWNLKHKRKISSIHEQRFKKHLKHVVKEIENKSETLLRETEMKSIQQKNHMLDSDSISEFKILSVKIPKTKLVENFSTELAKKNCTSEIELSEKTENQEKGSMELISKLKNIPSLIAFWANKKDLITDENQDFEEREKSLNVENLCQDCKRSDNYFKPKSKIEKCKDCGKARRVDSNLNDEISETSELFKTGDQDVFDKITFEEDNSSSTIIKCENSTVKKIDPPHELVENLAVKTLKLATKKAQDLYEDVKLCRQCLTSQETKNSDPSEPKEQKHSDFNTNDKNDSFIEKRLEFSPLDISKVKSKTLRKALRNLKRCQSLKESVIQKQIRNDDGKTSRTDHNGFAKSFHIIMILCFFTLWYLFI